MNLTPAGEDAGTALTPLQNGMLFHAITTPGRGVDIEQISFELREDVDPSRIVDAFNSVAAAHPILRSAFRWHDVDEPRRIVAPAVQIPCRLLDWSALSESAQLRERAELLAADRLTDFAMDRPPLQRLHLADLGSRGYWGLWTFHHALLDGRSFPIVLEQVFDLYDGREFDGDGATGSSSFDDFVAHVNALDHGATRTNWEQRLAGVRAAQSLTVWSDAHESKSGLSSGVAQMRLQAATTASLRSQAAAADVSLNNLVQAAWAILLDRYDPDFEAEGTRDIVFGTTRACRHLAAGFTDTIGLLINTLPLRVALDGQASVAALAKRLRSEQLSLRYVEATPLHLVQKWAGLAAGAQLFETLVVFDEASLDARMKARARSSSAARDRDFWYEGRTNYPLTLLAYGDEEMLVRLEYAVDRISPVAGEAMLRQLIHVLESFAESIDVPIGAVDILTDSDRDLLRSWNDTAVDYDLSQTLIDLFERQVDSTPEAVALTSEDRSLTYRQFDDQVNRLANHLVSEGVGPETVVAVYARRSIEMLVAIYGIVKAGGAYLPLNPDDPTERLAFMVEDAQPLLVVSAGGAADTADRLGIPVLDIDHDGEWASSSPVRPSTRPCADNAAYVIYTSGSTGRPKGVLNEHRGIVNRLLWMQDAFGLDANDVVIQKTPYTFDVSVWELFWPLQVGARLVIAIPDGHKDARYLAEEIVRSSVTTIHFVPSMLQLFVEQPGLESCSSLRRIVCSGEALPRDLQDRLFSRLEPANALSVELHNLYGPTEAAVDVTWWQCDRASELSYVPIGSAIANTTMHVLGPTLDPVPPGAKGELFIGGVQVARGYLNRPELNEQRFIPDPNGRAGSRLYRTGDLGRYRIDGSIEYLGRTDHQVKIRGFRIELGEIEVALSTHPAVAHCCVVDLEVRQGDRQLVAYYVPDRSQPVEVTDLRAHLSARLAEHMVPSFFVAVDEFPLSTAGKIDRSQLPAPSLDAAPVAVRPEGETERTVARIWCELLEIDEVDRGIAFFDAGGHSLLAIRLASALGQAFGRDIEVTELLANPTVEAQARMLESVPGSIVESPLAGVSDAAAARRKIAARRRAARRSR